MWSGDLRFGKLPYWANGPKQECNMGEWTLLAPFTTAFATFQWRIGNELGSRRAWRGYYVSQKRNIFVFFPLACTVSSVVTGSSKNTKSVKSRISPGFCFLMLFIGPVVDKVCCWYATIFLKQPERWSSEISYKKPGAVLAMGKACADSI